MPTTMVDVIVREKFRNLGRAGNARELPVRHKPCQLPEYTLCVAKGYAGESDPDSIMFRAGTPFQAYKKMRGILGVHGPLTVKKFRAADGESFSLGRKQLFPRVSKK